MKRTTVPAFKDLGAVEQALMDYVWGHGPVTAEACREAWTGRPLKDSTVRTMLRRLERKGYVAHTVSGRTFYYRALEQRESVAVRAVKHLLERFCGGSAEALVVGMVRHEVLDRRQLERIARRLKEEKAAARKARP